MFSQFKNKFPHFDQHLETYAHLFKRMELPPRTILLNEGQISKKSFWIEKGCVRVWFNNHGKDTTFQFFFENQSVSSVESFRKKIPSIFTVETIEPWVVYALQKNDFELMMGQLGKETEFLNQMMEVIFERQFYYMKEFLSLIKETPRERYLNLLREKPHIIRRVPQHYIASYLGITTVHLSRIRNQLVREKSII